MSAGNWSHLSGSVSTIYISYPENNEWMNHLKEWETSNWLWQIVHYIIIGIDNDIGKNFDICIHLNSLPRTLILYLVRVCTPRITNPYTWWRGGRPPTDQWPSDPKPAPSQHLASGHPSHFHSFVLPSQVDPVHYCLYACTIQCQCTTLCPILYNLHWLV